MPGIVGEPSGRSVIEVLLQKLYSHAVGLLDLRRIGSSQAVLGLGIREQPVFYFYCLDYFRGWNCRRGKRLCTL